MIAGQLVPELHRLCGQLVLTRELTQLGRDPHVLTGFSRACDVRLTRPGPQGSPRSRTNFVRARSG